MNQQRAVSRPAPDDHLVAGNSTRCVELLNGWQFDSLLEARVIIETWRGDDNWERPHTAHGDLTPGEFAATWTTSNQHQAA